jgi:hypothetical protein
MTNISLNISGKVSPEKLQVISDIKELNAQLLGIQFFIVGRHSQEFHFRVLSWH